MSVINQMLKDLEQRQNQASPASRLVESLGVRTERLTPRSKTVWRWLFPASAALLAASFLLSKGNSDTEIAAAPAAVIAPAGKAETVPADQPVANGGLILAADQPLKQEKAPEPVVEPARAVPAEPAESPAVAASARSSAAGAESSAVSAEAEAATPARAAPVTATTVAGRGEPSPRISEPAPAAVEEAPEAAIAVGDIKRPANTAQLAESRYQRALDYLQASRIEPAIEQLREALRLQADMHAARELLANLYLRTGRDAEAFMVLKAGLDADPQYLPFAMMYARTLVEQGQLPVARQVLEHSLLYAGNNADYQALLAAVEQRLGDHAAAVTRYMQALELKKQQGAWWVGMGISLEALGRLTEAGQAYRAARISPGLSTELIAYVESRLKELGSRS